MTLKKNLLKEHSDWFTWAKAMKTFQGKRTVHFHNPIDIGYHV